MEVVIWSMEEVLLWWLGILIGVLVFGTLIYFGIEGTEIDDEVGNKDLYDFIEKHLGKTFLKIFKIFI